MSFVEKNKMTKVYIASPYSHKHATERAKNFQRACYWSAKLRRHFPNFLFYSPIAHSHPISLHLKNPNDGEYWLKECIKFMVFFDELWILEINGWEQSKGIKKEMEFAEAMGMTVRFVKNTGQTEDGIAVRP